MAYMNDKQQASSGTSTPHRHNPFDTPVISSTPTQDNKTASGYFPPVQSKSNFIRFSRQKLTDMQL
jgi:hypothetical protein